ncbi:MAG: triphosphoribosyl-dephospho-CoA synthase [Promethearchaeota archaeon]
MSGKNTNSNYDFENKNEHKTEIKPYFEPPKKFETLIRLITNSSLSEVRAWPKPGNVHKTNNFEDTTYEDFLKAIYGLREIWVKIANKVEEIPENLSRVYSEGLIMASKKMMELQKGGNILLGHLLLMVPIFIVSCKFELQKDKFANNYEINKRRFWNEVKKIFEESTYHDTINLYKAIRIANPGGLSTIKKYDIFSPNAFKEIEEDNINLKRIFELSSSYDTISDELANNYKFIRERILPKMDKLIDEYDNVVYKQLNKLIKRLIRFDLIDINEKLNELVIRLFLYILGEKRDTLIVRKMGREVADKISEMGRDLFNKYYTEDKAIWFNRVIEFDQYLNNHENKGKLNPGTTADLLAATIYIKLVYIFFQI